MTHLFKCYLFISFISCFFNSLFKIPLIRSNKYRMLPSSRWMWLNESQCRVCLFSIVPMYFNVPRADLRQQGALRSHSNGRKLSRCGVCPRGGSQVFSLLSSQSVRLSIPTKTCLPSRQLWTRLLSSSDTNPIVTRPTRAEDREGPSSLPHTEAGGLVRISSSWQMETFVHSSCEQVTCS